MHDGSVQTLLLWSTHDLGRLAVYASAPLAQNKIASGVKSIQAGRLGKLEVRGSEIILDPPLIINKANIGRFDGRESSNPTACPQYR